jgi:hypothetical protein
LTGGNRELTRVEKRDGTYIDFGRHVNMGGELEATWYPDGKVFYFDGYLYEPIE